MNAMASGQFLLPPDRNPFLPNERPLETLDDAQKRTEKKLQVVIRGGLSLFIFSNLVKDAKARFAVNIENDDANRIFDATLFAHKLYLEPLRTAYKCALGIRFAKVPRKKQWARAT